MFARIILSQPLSSRCVEGAHCLQRKKKTFGQARMIIVVMKAAAWPRVSHLAHAAHIDL